MTRKEKPWCVICRNGSTMLPLKFYFPTQDDKTVDGGVKMEDAVGFFANVFGGERFVDYVSILLILCTHTILVPDT